MEEVQELKKEVQALKERNMRVDGDKAWETSWARRLSIAAATYIVATLVLTGVHATNPLWTACLPALGYIISTLSLPTVKRWWLESSTKA